jgi:2-keto-4-pentenoate hydratase
LADEGIFDIAECIDNPKEAVTVTEDQIATAAALLAEAERTGTQIETLPFVPETVDEAHRIQDRVAALLGAPIGAFKATALPDAEPTRGLIYRHMIRPSPASLAPVEVPQRGVEAEVAFRFMRALPARSTPYSRAEVAETVVALPAIEVVSGRYRDAQILPRLVQLADRVANGALVTGAEVADWTRLDMKTLRVVLTVNGETVVEREGGHPTGDPLGVAVALVNLMRDRAGVEAGQIVTTGSWTGLRFLNPGDRCAIAFAGLGGVELVFAG